MYFSFALVVSRMLRGRRHNSAREPSRYTAARTMQLFIGIQKKKLQSHHEKKASKEKKTSLRAIKDKIEAYFAKRATGGQTIKRHVRRYVNELRARDRSQNAIAM